MSIVERVAALSFWSQKVTPQPLHGGITNTNFTVQHGDERFVVRIGEDIPIHGVMRFNELAASRAGHACGLSPEVVYTEPGVLVIRFIEGKTFSEEDIQQNETLEKILPCIKRCHTKLPKALRGPTLMFWPFYVNRDYIASLHEDNSRMKSELPRLTKINNALEENVGQISVVFAHNDLLGGNFIDDGERVWMIDWDYAGWNSPLFDLSNLASNNLLSETQEKWLLENYFETPVDGALWKRYYAMKCASLLREALWSMVSEIHSSIDFDYVQYTNENMQRFNKVLEEYRQLV